MKKLLTMIAVFALTAPVFAAEGDPNVVISCNDLGGGLVQISYAIADDDGFDPSLETNRVRGFAFNITTTNGCLITAISDYDAVGEPVPADSTMIPQAEYVVYFGSIQFATDPNYISNYGDPVAPNTDPDALGGLGTTGITCELGALEPADGGTKPPASGDLFKIQLTDPTSAGSCVLTIAGEPTRGECVLVDGSPANIKSSGCTVLFDCMATTNPRYADWVDWKGNGPDAGDKPDCWCYQKQCHGDIDGALFGPFPVAANDFTALKAAISIPTAMLPDPGICADLNHAPFGPFRVASDDFAELKRWISIPNAMVPTCSGPGCVGFQGNAGAPGPCDSSALPNTEYIFWTN